MRSMTLASFKPDGEIHRTHEVELELANDVGCVVWTQPGCEIHTAGGVWITDSSVRRFFVYGAMLDLLEIYNVDGSPRDIYMNVMSPFERVDNEIHCIDRELDVLKSGDEAATILDEDEFDAAINKYLLSPDIVEDCRRAARCGLVIASSWRFKLASVDALGIFAARLAETAR